eukprot:TRINITY_DN54427_c0_g1_i2.p1 TRINITY_DN54427_c0_g1~~TRINITY_DN54427_c0_g1_i2.p1  ORF type:complete len:250 (-),score=73.47 TRINITY_DN54427_c0_g1_i2:257-1006(-)
MLRSLVGSEMCIRDSSMLTKEDGFTEQSAEGVDALVTDSRLVLLDTQAVLSASQLASKLSALKNNASPDAAAAVEKTLRVRDLQQAVLLFAVCHVVVILQDSLGDLPFLEFIKTADFLSSALGSSLQQRRVVWLHTNLAESDCEAGSREALCGFLSQFFASSQLGSLTPAEPSGSRGIRPEDVITLPGWVNREQLETAVHATEDVDATVDAGRADDSMSERKWLEHVSSCWDLILRKSSIVTEYSNKLA